MDTNKVKVPQCVADWIETTGIKSNPDLDILSEIVDLVTWLEDPVVIEIHRWLDKSPYTNAMTLLQAIVNDYEVGQLYKVYDPLTDSVLVQYDDGLYEWMTTSRLEEVNLVANGDNIYRWISAIQKNHSKLKYKFSEKDIEKLDSTYWTFVREIN